MVPRAKRERNRKADHPGFVQPALATLQTEPPTGARWVHEIKFDGYRAQASVVLKGMKKPRKGGLNFERAYRRSELIAKRRELLTAAWADR